VEQAAGRYLVWQNPVRQKIGRSWQEDRGRLVASTRLEKLTRDVRQRMSAVESISSFDELVSYTESNSTILLPPAQFSLIYNELPEIFQPLLVPTSVLVVLRKDEKIANVLVNRYSDRLEINLLNAHDQIVHRVSLSNEQIEMIVNYGKERQMDVRTVDRFAERVISASEFLDILDRQFYDDRVNLIRALPVLTDLGTEWVRVAFANKINAGFVETAFALDDYTAIIYYLPEEWVIDFILRPREYEESNYF